MTQRFSWAAFGAGMATFFGVASEMLSKHASWAELYASPMGVAHVLAIVSAFILLVGSALHIQLPRTPDTRVYTDRQADRPPDAAALEPTVVITKE